MYKGHVIIIKVLEFKDGPRIVFSRPLIFPSNTSITIFHIKPGHQYLGIWYWLCVTMEPKHKQILHIDISFERTMLVAERSIAFLINRHGKHPVSTEVVLSILKLVSC